MSVERSAARSQIVQCPRSFARFIEADGQRAIGQPGEGAATKQALQINDPVKTLLAHPPDAAPDFTPVLWPGPAPAVEENQTGQIRIAAQQRRKVGLDPPI